MSNKDKPISISFYESGNSIYELVGDGRNNFFAKYDFLSESVEICEKIHDGNQVIVPLADELSRNGVVLLPTEAAEFDSLDDLEEEQKLLEPLLKKMSDVLKKLAKEKGLGERGFRRKKAKA